MIRHTLGIAAVTTVLGLAIAAPATAQNHSATSGVRVLPAASAPRLAPKATGQMHPDTVYDVGCWTTFRPSSPAGGPMTQYYANCEHRVVRVCPAVDVNGSRTVYYGAAATLGSYDGLADDSDTAVWTYGSTIWNGQYTTVFC